MLRVSKMMLSFANNKPPPMPKSPRKKGLSLRRIALLAMTAFMGWQVLQSNNSKNEVEILMYNTEINREIIKNNQKLEKGSYKVTFYLLFQPVQFLFAKYIETRRYIKFARQEMIEGCAVDYMPVFESNKYVEKVEKQGTDRPCVVIIGGSEGFNQLMSSLMLFTCTNKFQVVGVCVNDIFDSAKLARVVSKIKQGKNGRVYGVGIQYGANLLVLANAQNPDLFTSIVSIGNPLDIDWAQKNVQNSFFASFTFLEEMIKGRIKNSNKVIPSNTPLPELSKLIYNLGSQEEVLQFKQNKSSINYIKDLKKPALFLQSLQDPFSIQVQNDQRIQSNPNTIFVITKHGGHNQWFQNLQATRWAPGMVVAHLNTLQKLFDETTAN